MAWRPSATLLSSKLSVNGVSGSKGGCQGPDRGPTQNPRTASISLREAQLLVILKSIMSGH